MNNIAPCVKWTSDAIKKRAATVILQISAWSAELLLVIGAIHREGEIVRTAITSLLISSIIMMITLKDVWPIDDELLTKNAKGRLHISIIAASALFVWWLAIKV